MDRVTTCPICRNERADVCMEHAAFPFVRKINCGHLLHTVCIDKLEKAGHSNCPICRTNMVASNAAVVTSANDGECPVCLDGLIPPCSSTVHNKTCDHGGIYHRCYIDRWLKCRRVCPLDNQTWIEGQATPRERELQQRVFSINDPMEYITKLVMDPSITPQEWEFIRDVQAYRTDRWPTFTDETWKSFQARFGPKPVVTKHVN